MKNFIRLAGIAALAALVWVSMTACKDPSSSPPQGTTFVIEGSFVDNLSQTNYFRMQNAEDYIPANIISNRNVNAESYAIRGDLSDGSVRYNLTGSYDPTTRRYTASAAGSMIRFAINGGFDESGNDVGSTATLLVNTGGDNWTSYTFIITPEVGVSIAGTPEPEVPGGIPSWARGWWQEEWTNEWSSGEAKYLFSQWTILGDMLYTYPPDETRYYESQEASVIEVTGSGSEYNIVMGYPYYQATEQEAMAAAAQFISENPTLSGIIPYYDHEYGDIYWGNLTEAQWNVIVTKWWYPDYLRNYLISISKLPSTMFTKFKAVFSSNNTMMTIYAYEHEWNATLSDVKDATHIDTEYPPAELRRW